MIKGRRQIEYNGDIVVEASPLKPHYPSSIIDLQNDNETWDSSTELILLINWVVF